MLPRARVCVAALMLCWACSGALALSKVTFAADIFFEKNSASFNGEYAGKLQELVCKVGTLDVEVAIAVGHASSDERDADRLARRRAESVANWLGVNAHWPMYSEGKGATLPVASNAVAEGRVKNRRVEVELVPKSMSGSAASAECQPEWIAQLFAAKKSASVVARELVRRKTIPADAPFRAALKARRYDVFDQLVDQSGIRLSAEQRAVVAARALDEGQLKYFIDSVRERRAALSASDLSRFLAGICNSRAGQAEKVAAVKAIGKLGGLVDGPQPLTCAVMSDSPDLVDAYLRTGGMRHMTPDVVVAAGWRTRALERLIAAGADPAVRTKDGATLFHTIRLERPADVQRLLDWGLDINGKGKTSPSNPETTPLRQAVSYASREVLEFMRNAGARLESDNLLGYARTNPAAQIWLIRNDVPVSDWGSTLVDLASQGDAEIPVMEALRERGLDLDATGFRGQTALGAAISRYAPALVRFLVESGATTDRVTITYREAPLTALELAERLPATYAEISGSSSPPRINPELQRLKDEIIDILKAARQRPRS